MIKRLFSSLLLIAILFSSWHVPDGWAQGPPLPAPGRPVALSPAFHPTLIKGVTINPDNPLMMEFIVDTGDSGLKGDLLQKESDKLVQYFLAALAIPAADFWVNLSPYEKDRRIPSVLGQTQMGRDLLAQDYLLKQISASLMDPDKKLGQKFWERIYAQVHQRYGHIAVPVNAFQKVWVVADQAEVAERKQTAWVVASHLKVMLDEDYVAGKSHTGKATPAALMLRELLIPEIEKEVNTGENFSTLRQIFNSLILASWYKKSLKQALLTQVYADKSKVNGIDLQDPQKALDAIYAQYLKAYKKGVFNVVKEAPAKEGGRPRKYFSGGISAAMAADPKVSQIELSEQKIDVPIDGHAFKVMVSLQASSLSNAMTADSEQFPFLNEVFQKMKELVTGIKGPELVPILDELQSQFYSLNKNTLLAVLDDLMRQTLPKDAVPSRENFLLFSVYLALKNYAQNRALDPQNIPDLVWTMDWERMQQVEMYYDHKNQTYANSSGRYRKPELLYVYQFPQEDAPRYIATARVESEDFKGVMTGEDIEWIQKLTDVNRLASIIGKDKDPHVVALAYLVALNKGLLPRGTSHAMVVSNDIQELKPFRFWSLPNLAVYYDSTYQNRLVLSWTANGQPFQNEIHLAKDSRVFIDPTNRTLVYTLGSVIWSGRIKEDMTFNPVAVSLNRSEQLIVEKGRIVTSYGRVIYGVASSNRPAPVRSFKSQVIHVDFQQRRRIMPTDSAMGVDWKKGGIDLNAERLRWKVFKQDEGVRMNIDPAFVKQMQMSGLWALRPKIIAIKPYPAQQIRQLLAIPSGAK